MALMNPKIVFATLALFMVTSFKCQECPPPKYQPELDCGKPTARSKSSYVIGGEPAIRGSWPWQVLLRIKIDKSPLTPFCGGSLIGKQWVLTAAHCIDGIEKLRDKIRVRFGEHDTRKDEGTDFDVKIIRIVKHPGYNRKTFRNDLALLQLEDSMPYNDYVKPVCLPEKDVPAGSYCWITGWGKIKHPGTMHHVLQEARLPVPTNKICDDFNYRKIKYHVDDTMMCGGDGGKTIPMGCHGDSGGPFVCHVNGKWELHGVVSWGNSHCKSEHSYTVFSRVTKNLNWIKGEIGPVGNLYRYWKKSISDHFYTMAIEELGKKGAYGWKAEGVQCRLLRHRYSTSVPLYRYWGNTDHFYTTNWKELGAGKYGLKYEGIAGYCFPKQHPCTVPLYRYYHHIPVVDHFYTTNAHEIGTTTPGHVGKYGYKSEGIACYVYP